MWRNHRAINKTESGLSMKQKKISINDSMPKRFVGRRWSDEMMPKISPITIGIGNRRKSTAPTPNPPHPSVLIEKIYANIKIKLST